MAVTDQQVSVLRALMGCDAEGYGRLLAGLDRDADKVGFAALLGCCFYEAVDRRFVTDGRIADASEVIEFVGEARAGSVELANGLDARVAERVILFGLGEGSLDDVNGSTYIHTQLLILAALAADERLDDSALDAFMARVRTRADDWTREPRPTEGARG
jgi:hypothetical protein